MKVRHPDVVQIAEVTVDGYGDPIVTSLTSVDATFVQGTSSEHETNADIAQTDAHVYLDIDHPLLTERGYRIEGMYLIANPFGAEGDESWYRIERVRVGQRKILTNDVNNVHAFLRKVAKPTVQLVS